MKNLFFGFLFLFVCNSVFAIDESRIVSLFRQIGDGDGKVLSENTIDMKNINEDEIRLIVKNMGNVSGSSMILNASSSHLPLSVKTTVSDEAIWMLNGYLGGLYPPMRRDANALIEAKLKVFKWLSENLQMNPRANQ